MTIGTSPVAPGQPRDLDGPVFAAPWEASAFAMAVKLSEAGHFTWAEWVETFSAVIAEHEQADHHHDHFEDREAADAGSEYYHLWFEALELILARKGILAGEALDAKHRYLRDNPVPHDHVARRGPICAA